MKIVRAKAPNGAVYRPIGGGNFHVTGKPYNPPQQARSYTGAAVSRLTADWVSGSTSADAEIWRDIRRLRDRCRDAERNNPYARRFAGEVEVNVLGHTGIGLQMKIRNPDGSLDTGANDRVENGFWQWGRSSSILGETWLDVQKLTLRSVGREGGVIVRKRRGAAAGNDFGFALQLLEIDHLDLDYQRGPDENGNEIRMGVEIDSVGRRVAYHLLTSHPGDTFVGMRGGRGVWRERIDASEIIFPFIKERIGQTIGVPMMAAVLQQLKMLGDYEEASLVAARAEACKMGFIQQERPDSYDGQKDANGNIITELAPGAIEKLNPGESFVAYDPKHPNGNYPDFRKGMLRGIAAGLGVSYNMLASDLEGVNYSSLRGGLLDEREMWKMLQSWFIDAFVTPVFEGWLEMALLNNKLGNLPFSRFDKFNSPVWKGRRWSWVDPLNDIQAAKLAIENNLTSHLAVIEEQGGDRDEVFEERKDDMRLAEQLGIVLHPDLLQPAATEPKPAEE